MLKVLVVHLFYFLPALTHADVTTYVQTETGAVWQVKNDVQISPQTGTYLEFDKFNPGPFPHLRLNGEIIWKQGHAIRFVLAPFRISVLGKAPSDINYRGETYNKNEEIEVNYKFDSYRIGYFYEWNENEGQFFRFGGTGNIRSA